MCSNYKFSSNSELALLNVDTSQFELDLKAHVYSSYHAPVILRGFDLDVAKFGMLPGSAKDFKFSKFCLVSVIEFYEPKYINGKPHWYTIRREDSQPFTVASIYEDAVIRDSKVRSFSMLTINADHHPFMKQFHAPDDEKRSIIVIPEQYRSDWLNADHEHAHEYFLKCRMNT